MLDPKMLLALPTSTIVYNFEQGRNQTPEQTKPQLRVMAERFEVWDYSASNGHGFSSHPQIMKNS